MFFYDQKPVWYIDEWVMRDDIGDCDIIRKDLYPEIECCDGPYKITIDKDVLQEILDYS